MVQKKYTEKKLMNKNRIMKNTVIVKKMYTQWGKNSVSKIQ